MNLKRISVIPVTLSGTASNVQQIFDEYLRSKQLPSRDAIHTYRKALNSPPNNSQSPLVRQALAQLTHLENMISHTRSYPVKNCTHYEIPKTRVHNRSLYQVLTLDNQLFAIGERVYQTERITIFKGLYLNGPPEAVDVVIKIYTLTSQPGTPSNAPVFYTDWSCDFSDHHIVKPIVQEKYRDEEPENTIVFPLFAKGSLDRLPKNEFRTENIAPMVRALLKSVSSLHQKGIAHLDLKPENLFPKDPYILIDDFESFVPSPFALANPLYTPEFIAPETNRGTFCTQPADMYSVGKILTWFRTMLNHSAPQHSEHNLPWLDHLIANLCQANPQQRYTASQALAYLHTELTPASQMQVTTAS